MQDTPVGSVLEGRVDGVCMMLYFALRRKSAEPPRPLSILEPMTQVEFAWAYMSLVFVSLGSGQRLGRRRTLQLEYSCQ